VTLERRETSAVLFADISGSTRLYAESGNDRAREVVARTLHLWSALIESGGGKVIQLRGDGLLCIFDTVDAALAAAVAMRDLPYQEPLSMHAGLNYGPILRESEQLYGDVVNVAARMADIAKNFEIVITGAARAGLLEPGRWPLRLIRNVAVKGKPEPMDVYLLANDRQGVTDYRPPLHTKTVLVTLRLNYASGEYVVDHKGGACLIGRDEDCRIKVQHGLVSRRHASIECVFGRFFLHDHSTNGTYVQDSDAPAILVHRELFQLKDRGVISLGIEPQQNLEHSIRYAIGS
jgi:class 3 adenylate cyclase